MNSRRSFVLGFIGILSAPSRLMAYPLDRLLGQPPTSYVQEYIRRYWAWYQNFWFSFEDKMSSRENNLFQYWKQNVGEFGIDIQGHYIETFLTRHFLTDESKRHDRFYCGLPEWKDDGIKLFSNFIKVDLKGFHFSDERIKNLYGWSHDFGEKEIKLWFRNPKIEDFINPPTGFTPILGFLSFKEGELYSKGLVTSMSKEKIETSSVIDQRLILDAFLIVDSQGNRKWKYRTRGTYLPLLNKRIPWVSAKHRNEFRQAVDFIDPNGKESLKVYYP